MEGLGGTFFERKMSMRARLVVLLGLLAVCAQADLVPEYEIQFSDVSLLKKAMNDNAWAKEFAQSNLYRGTMVKLGPVLFAVGNQEEDSWKGRLLDFLFDKILEGKRIGVSYFHQTKLVSPLGITVYNLSAADKALVGLFVEKNKLGPAVDAAEDDEEEAPKNKKKVKVQPIGLRLQKFALVQGENCLAISRDPKLAANLGQKCDKAPQKKGDAVVSIDLKEFFPSWYPVLDKVAGFGGKAELAFDYDKGQSCFVPAKAEVGLKPKHLMGQGKLSPELLGAIPADTLLQITSFLPVPTRLGEASMDTFFEKKGATGKPPIPITVLYFGMKTSANGKPEAMSALLLPQDNIDDALLADVNKLFNQKSAFEVGYRKACGGYLALSPSATALDKIEATCAKKQASYAQMPQFLVKALTQDGISSSAVLNLGGFLKSALSYGWERENAPDSAGKANVPKEVAQAMDLLGRLPLYAFAGKAEKDKLAMNGVKP